MPPGGAYDEQDLGEDGLWSTLGQWSMPVRREALTRICDLIKELWEHKPLRRCTWVSVPLLTAGSTITLSSDSIQDVGPMDRYVTSQGSQKQWVPKGETCPICGLYRALSTVVLQSAESPLQLCMHHLSSEPLVTKAWGTRSSVGWGDMSLVGALPVRNSKSHVLAAVVIPDDSGGACASWVQSYEPRMLERHKDGGPGTAVDILVLQVGGGAEKLEAVEDWILGLDPAIVLRQELWDLRLGDQAWTFAFHVFEGVKGQGLGQAVLVAKHLLASSGSVSVVQDEGSGLAVAMEAVTGEVSALASVHVRPGDSFSDKKASLRKLTLSLKAVGPDSVFVAGEFNSQYHVEKSPLGVHADRSKKWLSLGLQYCGQPDAVTNEVLVKGTVHVSSIDHGFGSGVFGGATTRSLLPGVSTHKAQLFVASVHGSFVRPFAWKRYKWRFAEESIRGAMMAVMELLWFWVAIGGGGPDHYLGVYHSVADQLVYKDPTKARDAFIKRLRSGEDALGLIARKRRMMEAAAVLSELGLKDDHALERKQVGITSATRKHMRMSKAALCLFRGIKAAEGDKFVDAEETLREITLQATENDKYRGDLLRAEVIRSTLQPQPVAEHCVDRLPDDLWIAMRQSGLDLEVFTDRVSYAASLVSEGPQTAGRLYRALDKHMTDATSLDQMPVSQWKQGGGITRQVLLVIMQELRNGTASLFNAVAHYGIRKKEPFYFLSGFGHIYVESALSRLDSACDHQLLRDVGELTGVWSPALFSYHQGFSPSVMAVVLRRSCYKLLVIWGEVWILDWDETGAFPKLQMRNLSALLRIAESEGDVAVWDCQEQMDQFHRTQRLYPVTEFGLGEPYQAEDGALEGDSAAPAIYQTASAVRTACITEDGAARFSLGAKQVALSELVFSDDRRIFHHDRKKFEQWVENRIVTTKAAGGIVNPTKLELFHAVQSTGTIQFQPSEACVGIMMHASEEPPTCIGVPLFLGHKFVRWSEETEQRWSRITIQLGKSAFLPIKRIRVVLSFMISRFDYVASAFLFDGSWLDNLQRWAVAAFCDICGLSKRTARLFLYLPVQFGGAGCPWLELRAHLRYLNTATGLSYGRSGLGRMVASELFLEDAEGVDVHSTRRVMQQYGISVLQQRGSSLEHWVPKFPATEEPWLLVSDGGLRGHRAGVGVVLAQGMEVRQVTGYGICVHAGDSTVMEWIAKGMVLLQSSGLPGRKMLGADLAAGGIHRTTSSPFWHLGG